MGLIRSWYLINLYTWGYACEIRNKIIEKIRYRRGRFIGMELSGQ